MTGSNKRTLVMAALLGFASSLTVFFSGNFVLSDLGREILLWLELPAWFVFSLWGISRGDASMLIELWILTNALIYAACFWLILLIVKNRRPLRASAPSR
jgi:hypothetical protein